MRGPMATIDFAFGAPISLGPMVPGGGPGTGMVPPGIPAASGLYAIHNTTTNNWYFGSSTNIHQRFNARAQTVAEMGFAFPTIAPINAYVLTTTCCDTGGAPHVVASWSVIDGLFYNLERVLIMYMLNWANIFPATVSNSAVPGGYGNMSPNNIAINGNYVAPGGVLAFAAVTWLPGTSL